MKDLLRLVGQARRYTVQLVASVILMAAAGGATGLMFGADGRLYALDVTTGKEVWQFEAGGAVAEDVDEPSFSSAAIAVSVTAAARSHRASESFQAGTICMVAHSSKPSTTVTPTATNARARGQASSLASGQASVPRASSAYRSANR